MVQLMLTLMYKCTINFIPLSQPSLNFKLTTSPDKSEYFFDGLNDGGALMSLTIFFYPCMWN
jgi:hypothetical protein